MSKKKWRGWAKKNAPASKEQNPARNEVQPAEPFSPVPSMGAVSAAKIAANRANAQFSTGAVTPEGKAIVSQNATKHGLTGNNFRVLASESQKEFDQLLAGFLRSEEPVGEDEVAMVHQMAECVWLSRRSIRMQNDCWAILESCTDEERRAAHKSVALYLRYMTTHDRAYSRYAAELRKRRNERRKLERGFVSQKHREAAEARRASYEVRKNELHQLRRQSLILHQQRVEINNRLAAAKAEALERKNLAARKPESFTAAA
jgi:hypothetical protein